MGMAAKAAITGILNVGIGHGDILATVYSPSGSFYFQGLYHEVLARLVNARDENVFQEAATAYDMYFGNLLRLTRYFRWLQSMDGREVTLVPFSKKLFIERCDAAYGYQFAGEPKSGLHGATINWLYDDVFCGHPYFIDAVGAVTSDGAALSEYVMENIFLSEVVYDVYVAEVV